MQPLSIVPYYGGKYKMATLIAGMLDYKNTDVFFAPFGGGARELLNKPRHAQEVYAEVNAGMSALVKALTNKESAMELIGRLYETDFSEECFIKHQMIKDDYEDHYLKQLIGTLKKYLKYIDKSALKRLDRLLEKIYTGEIFEDNTDEDNEIYIDIKDIIGEKWALVENEQKTFMLNLQDNINVCIKTFYEQMDFGLTKLQESDIENEIGRYINKYIDEIGITSNELGDRLKNFMNPEETDGEYKDLEISRLLSSVGRYKKKMDNDAYKENFFNTIHIDRPGVNEMDLAVATYVVFTQSRDGIGKDWKDSKFKTTEAYHNKISKLYDVMYRLEGVTVLEQVDALVFLYQDAVLNNERWMVYCDPPYLKQKSSDDDNKARGADSKSEYNPGLVYKDGWSRGDHERFIEKIKNARCKMLVSNYDDEEHLYDTELRIKCGWKRFDYETRSAIQNSGNPFRTECLWYNY